MSEMGTNERVMVFVDVRNVLRAFDDDLQFCQVDINGMVRNLTNGRNTIRPYAYDGSPWSDGKGEGFHNHLCRCGFTMRLSGPYNLDEPRQKGVDVNLATDMVLFAYADQYDIAILVSGDSDFVPAVEKVKLMGKKVEVASFENGISASLRLSADRYHNLDDVPMMKLRSPRDSEEVSE